MLATTASETRPSPKRSSPRKAKTSSRSADKLRETKTAAATEDKIADAKEIQRAPEARRDNHVSTTDQIRAVFELTKQLALGVLAMIGTIMTGVSLYRAMTDNSVVMMSLKVPASLEQKGYNSDTSTNRLIDEVAALNKKSGSAKDKTNFADSGFLTSLAQVQTPIGLVNMQNLQAIIQDILGKTTVKVSGDITVDEKEGKPTYRLRVRQMPEREVLVDVESAGTPEDLFRSAAMRLMEKVDPLIAAALSWQSGDDDSALRLIETIMAGGRPAEEKYALNLKAQVLMRQKRPTEAFSAVQDALARDENFAPALFSKANLLREWGRLDEARTAAERAIHIAPDRPWGYFNRGLILRQQGKTEEAIASLREANNTREGRFIAPTYYQLADTLRLSGRLQEAEEILIRGTHLIPEVFGLRKLLADIQISLGKPRDARKHYGIAHLIEPLNPFVMVPLAESFAKDDLPSDARAIVAKLRALKPGAIPAPLRTRIEDLFRKFPD